MPCICTTILFLNFLHTLISKNTIVTYTDPNYFGVIRKKVCFLK